MKEETLYRFWAIKRCEVKDNEDELKREPKNLGGGFGVY